MTEKRWTDLTIRAFKPHETEYELKAPGFPGLRLVIRPHGGKRFIFRYTFGGTYKKLTFNEYVKDTGALAAALAQYRDAETELHNGRDPADLMKRQRAGNSDAGRTVTAYLELYRQQHVFPNLALTTQDYTLRELRIIGEAVGAKDIREVTQDDIQKIIDRAISRKGRANGLAARNKAYQVAKHFFAWATNRAGIDSPALRIERPAKDREGERVLDDNEVKIVWKAATDAGGAAGALVKLLLLTGCRRDEIAYLERSEVKPNAIELPGRRTKNCDPHHVDLTWLMRRVLAELPKGGKYVLNGNAARADGDTSHATSRGGLGGHTKAHRAVADLTGIPHWTFHDLRRTFATGLARLGVPLVVAERCLNHRQGVGKSQLQRIYNKYTYEREIRDAFEHWTNHVAVLVGEQQDKAAA